MIRFFKKEPVLVISFFAALVSCFFVAPSKEYIDYIDFRVLALLFCLMSAVGGIQKSGFFEYLSVSMLKRTKSSSGLCLILVMLAFFLSMLVTNDVALIITVPFAIAVLSAAGLDNMLIKTVVLQTVGANLGSMATPVGNPQNLFLYSYYNFSTKEFLAVVLPYAAISFVLICIFCMAGKKTSLSYAPKISSVPDKKRLIVYLCLMLLSILTVVRLIHFAITTIITIAVLLIRDRDILKKNDYCLLLTFICFFVFSGNLGKIDAVSQFLRAVLEKNTIVCSALTSQIISNVPAAVVLAPFTRLKESLLLGVNIGGLGTPIASLASLISMKLYMNTETANSGRYICIFLLYNIIGLIGLLLISNLLSFA